MLCSYRDLRETEALKGLTGEGGLDVTMVNSMLPKARGRLASDQAEYEKIKAAVEKNAEADRQRAGNRHHAYMGGCV